MPTERTGGGRSHLDLANRLGLNLEIEAAARRVEPGDHAGGVGLEEFARVCGVGERNPHMARVAGRLVGAIRDTGLVTEICLALNRQFIPPLPDDEVREVVDSIARGHAKRHPVGATDDTPLFDLRSMSVSRFLRQEPPQREWVLENVLPLGKAALLVAPGGTGKSQLLIQIGVDVATGQQQHSPWKPSTAGKVVILSAEDEEEELHRRLWRLVREDLTSADGQDRLQLLEQNFYIVPRVGEDSRLTAERNREIVQTGVGNRIAASLQGVPDVRLIILDPLARFRGGHENDAEPATRIVEAMEALAKETGAAILAAHHTNKATLSASSEPTQNASRGSSALVDGVRLVMNLSVDGSGRRGRDKRDQLLDLRITKTNYGPLGEPVHLRRDGEGILRSISAEDADAKRDHELLSKLANTLISEAEAGRHHSKSTFAAKFGGLDAPFGMGQAKLKAYIDGAVSVGVLEVDVTKEKLLTVRPKTDRD